MPLLFLLKLMKKNYLFILTLLIALISGVNSATAQCALSGSYWGEMLPTSGTTFVPYSPFGPGQYFRMPILLGGSYTVSTCGASIDTQLTGYQGTSPQVFYNDDNGPICSGTQASYTYVSTFTDYLRVQVSQYNCLPGGSSSITVNVRQNNNLTFTSSAADMCAGDVRTLTATPAPVATANAGSGDWGTFTGTGVSGATFTAPTPAGASQTYTLTYTFGYVSATQNITVYAAPSTADAGPDQTTICGTTATLGAATPTIGNGSWSVISGPGTVTTPGSANSGVTGLVAGSPTTLRWTVTNGPCATSTDDVVLSVETVAPVPVVANLSPATGECSVTPTPPSANDACSGVITGVPNVTFPITTQGTTVVTWTYTDGNGNSSTQTQDVVVDDATAPVADNATLADATGFCQVDTLVPPTATDNCAGAITGTTTTTFPITTQGTTVVTWTYDDGNGNTSTQNQNVIVSGPDVSVTQTGATLTANSTGGTFQWLDCDNGFQIIAGETNASFTPMAINGNYAVMVTENGCVDTSACYNVDYTGIEEYVSNIEVNIYPNPSEGKFNVELVGISGGQVEIRIVDLQGRLVYNQILQNVNDKQVAKVDISAEKAGVYILKVSGQDGAIISTERIIKN